MGIYKHVGAALAAAWIILFFSPAAFSQAAPDLSGEWTLTSSGLLHGENVPCQFTGGGLMAQRGDDLAGQATLTRVSGPASCPAEMMADMRATVDGQGVYGSLDGGQLFGVLQFSGSVDAESRQLSGSYTVDPGGPYGRATGDFHAAWSNGFADVPGLNIIGFLLLAGILSYAGASTLRRQRTELE